MLLRSHERPVAEPASNPGYSRAAAYRFNLPAGRRHRAGRKAFARGSLRGASPSCGDAPAQNPPGGRLSRAPNYPLTAPPSQPSSTRTRSKFLRIEHSRERPDRAHGPRTRHPTVPGGVVHDSGSQFLICSKFPSFSDSDLNF